MQTPFASTPEDWKAAERPNYNINKDLEFPYSECPYLGEYDLIRIPRNGFIEHVDYWGEGYIKIDAGISGFKDCYNVNHAYQLVSNGNADTIDRKIPNRIPVVDYDNCNTHSYIKDKSVKIVTLMGAPINKSCAADIGRIIYDKEGLVVLFGIDRNMIGVKYLEEVLNKRDLVFCPKFELPERLQGLTLFDRHLAFLNTTDYNDILYNSITSAFSDVAVQLSLELRKANQKAVVSAVLERLLEGPNTKTMAFAYWLWVGGAQDLVSDIFPSEFQNILRSDNMRIVNKYYDQAMKLDSHTDPDNDRQAWGDSKDKTSEMIKWKFIPQSQENRVYFRIKHVKHSMFLKLDVNINSDGDRKCWGSEKSDEERHKWVLAPVRVEDDVLFIIDNHAYRQGLKLDKTVDIYGDRAVFGHNGNAADNPKYFGWLIKPM